MDMDINTPKLPTGLARALRSVADRYTQRRRVRGRIVFGLVTLLVLAVGTVALVAIGRGNPIASNTVILTVLILEAVAAIYWLVYRARRPIALKQLALYIDQKHPELQNRIVSAIEFAGLDKDAGTRPGAGSTWLVERFLEETDLVTRAGSIGDVFDTRRLVWSARLAALLLIAGGAIVLVFNSVWLPELSWSSRPVARSAAGPAFTVQPGNAEIRAGDNVIVVLETNAPVSDAVLAWGPADAPKSTTAMTVAADANVWHHVFRNVQEDFEYRIHVGPSSSEQFRITTWTPPRTEAIHLGYTFPEYLNRPDEEWRNSGPITAIAGTRVRVEVEVNKPLQEAALVLDDGGRIALEKTSDTSWTGELLVETTGAYHVALTDATRHGSEYQPRYAITALTDAPPAVRISFPRGDDEVTALEEIPFTFDVTDDFGLAAYGIQYEVAGREPVRVVMSPDAGEDDALVLSVSGEHFLALEELGLEPGDLVTWAVWAKDYKPGRDEYEELGDPYFLEVRPFRRTFTEAVSNAGGDQQQQQGGGAESADQKAVLIATWNLRRSFAASTEDDFLKKRNGIIEAQNQLLAQSREAQGSTVIGDLLAPDTNPWDDSAAPGAPALRRLLVEAQERVVDALREAALPEPGRALTAAMEHAQKAYSLLMKLESDERSVQLARNTQGGQGGSQGASQREIDQLELNLNRNFYEEEQSPRATAAQRAAEDALAALKELAQRQQLANDEMSKLISELQRAKTEEEREEIQRRLKRLEEEMQRNLESLDQLAGEAAAGEMDPQQARAAQGSLNRARNDMNRSLEEVRQERLQQARAAGTRAADALDEMQRELSSLSRSAAADNLRDLTRQLEVLERRQEQVVEDLEELAANDSKKSLEDVRERDSRQKGLIAEKEAMAESLDSIMEDAARLAEGTRESQELLSRKLNDWLRETAERGIADSMRQTAPLVNYGIWDPLIEAEQQTTRALRASAEALRGLDLYQTDDEIEALRMAHAEIQQLLDGPARDPFGGEGEDGQPGLRGDNAEGDGHPAPSEQQEPADTGGGGGGEPNDEAEPRARAGRQETAEARGDGGGDDAYGGYGPDNIEDFIARDYGRWLDSIRDAEGLLPNERLGTRDTPDGSTRQRLERVRETIGGMRRDYRTYGVPPQFEGFLDQVVQPLVEAAAEIDEALRARMRDDEFALTKEADVPAQFQGNVATYFRLLSEAAAGD
jgi:hypothetical protein